MKCVYAFLAVVALFFASSVSAQMEEGVTVNIADERLARHLSFTQARVVKQGLLSTAVLTLQNASSRPLDITYFAEWSSGNGIPLEPEQTNSVWETIRIDGSASRSFTISGRHPRAKTLSLTVKPVQ